MEQLLSLYERARDFRQRLKQIKQQNISESFSWYGYDTLATLHFLNELMERDHDVLSSIAGGQIADIGAGDGDLAYFLESEGYAVSIIDHAPTNWNGLKGARALKTLLESRVAIHDINLDSAFELPRQRYDLVLFLGILYHLKNPFYVLESLAAQSRYMFLSTRIARYTPVGVEMQNESLAYLLGPDECNNDPTNYWIFSAQGLTRLLDRCGWTTRVMLTAGDLEHSDPANKDHDERAFVLAESRVAADVRGTHCE